MKVAAMLLWMITAGVGLYLLMRLIEARRSAAAQAGTPATDVSPAQTTTSDTASTEVPAGVAIQAGHAIPAGAGAVPAPATPLSAPSATPSVAPATTVQATATATAEAGLARVPGPLDPPPIPKVRVKATPGEHPLAEFSHPALAIAGLGAWIMFVASHFAVFAWASLTMLVIAILIGIGWLASRVRAARRGPDWAGAKARAPLRLIALHGLGATTTFALAVLTMLAAVHA